MFSDILDFFDDFPQVTVSLYGSQSDYDPDTGELTEGYTLNETLSAWGFQKSAVQNYIRDKVFDDVDKVYIFEQMRHDNEGSAFQYIISLEISKVL